MSERQPTCETCKFYCGATGECRRNGPNRHGTWPEVLSDDWCGKHQPWVNEVRALAGPIFSEGGSPEC